MKKSSATAPRRAASHALVVGIDTGGTFTDLVALVDGDIRVHKVLSTPDDPAEAVIAGLRALLEDMAPTAVTYSSTVATNALLEKKGARVALFTDRGFEDLIEIGRQNRSELYALAPSRPQPLIPRAMRFGVGGRTHFDGQVAVPLEPDELARIRQLAERSRAEAFAVCLLHSYANPASEEALARALKPLNRPLSVSHRILPEYREYERMSTTVVNSYVAPRMVAHLENLERQLKGAPLRVMQSNGSAVGSGFARDEPVRTIASVDAGGSLKVGPESAGANPGPACYGRGDFPTVTDADLVAGRLVAENFLGGRMKLYPERAVHAIERLGRPMRSDMLAGARGVIRVVNANMERAIRVITVERGFDAREFALMAFGGAGPMHACELALDLGIRHIVLPRNPGLLCAWGAVGGPLGREYSLTVREATPDLRRLVKRAQPMVARARADLVKEGTSLSTIRHELWADMRYRGQSYEIEVRLGPRFVADFHAAHHRTFGHSAPDAAVEVVNLRLRAEASGPMVVPRRLPRVSRKLSPASRASVIVGGAQRTVPVYARDAIGPDARLAGPMVITELSATAYVSPEFALRCDDFGNLHLETR